MERGQAKRNRRRKWEERCRDHERLAAQKEGLWSIYSEAPQGSLARSLPSIPNSARATCWPPPVWRTGRVTVSRLPVWEPVRGRNKNHKEPSTAAQVPASQTGLTVRIGNTEGGRPEQAVDGREREMCV